MRHPYTFYQNSSILLSDIAIPRLPEEIVFEGQKLFVKDEFHITLVSASYLAQIIDPHHRGFIVDQISQEFDRFTEATSLEKYKISSDLRFAQTDKEKTIVVMAGVPDLDKFFDYLGEKFSLKLPTQRAHVTLYRYPEDFIGIPIPSAKTLWTISRPIEIPELQELL
jgi:hypothetical protein